MVQIKSLQRQTGLLYNPIPADLYKLELRQIIKTCVTLANTVILLREGTFVGGDKYPPR